KLVRAVYVSSAGFPNPHLLGVAARAISSRTYSRFVLPDKNPNSIKSAIRAQQQKQNPAQLTSDRPGEAKQRPDSCSERGKSSPVTDSQTSRKHSPTKTRSMQW